jgi:hypothetical protein
MRGDLGGDGGLASDDRAHRALADARWLYRREVVRVAEDLRRELQTGEMGEWEDGDEVAFPRGEAPRHLLETEVAARFVGSLDSALIVLSASPHARELMPDLGSTTGFTTMAAAITAMASDVLDLARGRGWLR